MDRGEGEVFPDEPHAVAIGFAELREGGTHPRTERSLVV
jgi:hypothetical protein